MFRLLRYVSLRHLIRAPLRTALTVSGVAVGAATMVGIAVINRSVLQAFRSTVDTIAGKAELTVSSSEAGFDDGWVDKIRQLSAVAHASGALTAFLPVNGSPGETLMVMGVDLIDDGYFRTYQGVGRDISTFADDLEFLNSTNRLLVSERFAAEHRLRIGDSFELATAEGVKPFVVHGLIGESGPVKAFGGSVAVMYLGSAQEGFNRGHLIDRIDIALNPTVSFEAGKAQIQALFGPSFEIERPSRRGGTVEKMVRSFQLGLNLGSGIALLVGVFLVYNTIAIGVVQRRREIGTLRALGGTRRQVGALFTLEAAAFGLIGTLLGIPLGVAVGRAAIRQVSSAVSAIYVQVRATDVRLTAVEMSLALALGIGGSIFAALRPATNASKVHPVEALRRDLVAGVTTVSIRSPPVYAAMVFVLSIYPLTLIPPPVENFALGGYASIYSALMAATLLSPLIVTHVRPIFELPAKWALGVSGKIAADNFGRAPARTAVPVSALALGIAMSICISGYIGSFHVSMQKWISQSVPADLFVTSSAKLAGVQNVPLSSKLFFELQQIPGVADVDLVRIFPHDLLGLRVSIISNRPEVYFPHAKVSLLEGAIPTPREQRAGSVIISENLSRRRNLHVGDSFEIATPTGLNKLRVAGVMIDYTSDQGMILMDRASFVEQFKDERVDTFELYLSDTSRADEVRREVTRRMGRAYNLYVMTNSDMRREAFNLVESALTVTYAMEIVAVVLALLGVINTLLAAVLDRTREIGLLRAIGAARNHIIRLFVAEAAFIGLTGGLMGSVAGVVSGFIVTKVVGVQATGWSFPFVVPSGFIIQIVSAAAGCAIVAGIYPARRAAKLDVVEALAYE